MEPETSENKGSQSEALHYFEMIINNTPNDDPDRIPLEEQYNKQQDNCFESRSPFQGSPEWEVLVNSENDPMLGGGGWNDSSDNDQFPVKFTDSERSNQDLKSILFEIADAHEQYKEVVELKDDDEKENNSIQLFLPFKEGELKKHPFSDQSKKLFPFRLWSIVNECKSDAIKWSETDSILFDIEAFAAQYFGKEKYFKTTNHNSFIRQLHLYGFRKISPKCANKKIILSDNATPIYQEFKHHNFKQGRPDLLQHIIRPSKRFKSRESRLQTTKMRTPTSTFATQRLC